MNEMQWIIVESPAAEGFIGPPKPPGCHKGWTSHRWMLDIEEGHLGLSTKECRLCNDGIDDLEHELLGGSFPVELTFHRETYGYYHPEIVVWFEISPETKVPGD